MTRRRLEEPHAMLRQKRPGFFEDVGVEVAPRRPARKRDFRKSLESAMEDARARKERRGDPNAWSDATAATLVGLYAILHLQVYGVAAAELVEEYLPARSSADRCARDLGSVERVVALLRWRWTREQKRIRDDGATEYRIGWKLMFSRKMVTDFKVARPHP